MTNSNTNIDASNTEDQISAQRAMTKSQSIKTRSDSSWWDQRLARRTKQSTRPWRPFHFSISIHLWLRGYFESEVAGGHMGVDRDNAPDDFVFPWLQRRERYLQ